MTRWPPIAWLLVTAASLLIIVGVGGDENPQALIPGIVLALAALALSMYLAFGRWGNRPRATGLVWMLPALAVFYVVCAAVSLIAGAKYMIAAIGASLIPLTAVALLIATTRAKTVGSDDARRETTTGASEDPFPGVGMDDETPLGDTPEHSTAERVAQPDRRFGRGEDS
jgi:hypothetical protein